MFSFPLPVVYLTALTDAKLSTVSVRLLRYSRRSSSSQILRPNLARGRAPGLQGQRLDRLRERVDERLGTKIQSQRSCSFSERWKWETDDAGCESPRASRMGISRFDRPAQPDWSGKRGIMGQSAEFAANLETTGTSSRTV
ncbi:hypothetical protein PV10_06023 [Exophiala mesophila]|uniref:Uncharacterized protein n=1 Tax=Exophiala mesophila TaxID=212818 RepID=A0A0D1ZXH0_EXOME|nr:uncharacterized protein PV10_06023 [Exophiala mesophila]KIV91488.1 hypothetical protein PV10_06023 [Exophiala mesophila]